MNIIQTLSSVEHRSSGPTYSVTALAEGLAMLGATSSVYSVGCEAAGGERNHGWVDRRFPPSFASVPVLSKLRFSMEMRAALAAAGADVVHNHGLWLGTNSYPAIFRNSRTKVVISPRGMLSPAALSFSRFKKAVARRAFQDRAIKSASMFHATCEAEYGEIRSFGIKCPVAIIPNGVRLPTFPTAVTKQRTALYLSRVHPKKGADTLVEAWAEIERQFPDWTLVIAGPEENGFGTHLRQRATDLRCERVRFVGEVYGEQRDIMMAAAEVFVLPTRNENFGLAIAESLAAGTPVITTIGAPWAGLRSHRCGWWIDFGVAALRDALRNALSLPSAARRDMGERGSAWMKEQYSWTAVAESMLAAYQWVIGAGDRPVNVVLE